MVTNCLHVAVLIIFGFCLLCLSESEGVKFKIDKDELSPRSYAPNRMSSPKRIKHNDVDPSMGDPSASPTTMRPAQSPTFDDYASGHQVSQIIQQQFPTGPVGVRRVFYDYDKLNGTHLILQWYGNRQLYDDKVLLQGEEQGVIIDVMDDAEWGQCWYTNSVHNPGRNAPPWNKVFCTISTRKHPRFKQLIEPKIKRLNALGYNKTGIMSVTVVFPAMGRGDIIYQYAMRIHEGYNELTIDLLFEHQYNEAQSSQTNYVRQSEIIIYTLPQKSRFQLRDYPLGLNNIHSIFCWFWSLVQSITNTPEIMSEIIEYYEDKRSFAAYDDYSQLMLSVWSSILQKDKYELNTWSGKRYNIMLLLYRGYNFAWEDPAIALNRDFAETSLAKKYFSFQIDLDNTTDSNSRDPKILLYTRLPRRRMSHSEFYLMDEHGLEWYMDTTLDQLNLSVTDATFVNNSVPKLLLIQNFYAGTPPLAPPSNYQQQVRNVHGDITLGGYLYELWSKVVYTGSHYFVYIRYRGRWWLMDDEKTRIVGDQEAMTTVPHYQKFGYYDQGRTEDAVQFLYRRKV